MPAPRDFPFEACRDLLGVLRAVFAAQKRRSFPNARKLKMIERLAVQSRTCFGPMLVRMWKR